MGRGHGSPAPGSLFGVDREGCLCKIADNKTFKGPVFTWVLQPTPVRLCAYANEARTQKRNSKSCVASFQSALDVGRHWPRYVQNSFQANSWDLGASLGHWDSKMPRILEGLARGI